MDDKKLVKLSIVSSLLGILLLYYVASASEVPQSDISSITNSMIDKDVSAKGILTKVTKTEKVVIMTLKDSTGSITVVSFEPEKITSIRQGQQIQVQGKVSLYKNTLEIIADKIGPIDD